MCAAAGVAIGTAALGNSQSWTAVAVFTAIGALGGRTRARVYPLPETDWIEPLSKLKTWMEDNHAGMIARSLIDRSVLWCSTGNSPE